MSKTEAMNSGYAMELYNKYKTDKDAMFKAIYVDYNASSKPLYRFLKLIPYSIGSASDMMHLAEAIISYYLDKQDESNKPGWF